MLEFLAKSQTRGTRLQCAHNCRKNLTKEGKKRRRVDIETSDQIRNRVMVRDIADMTFDRHYLDTLYTSFLRI